MKEAEKKAEGKLNPATHVGSEQLLDSATLLYRVGASEAEIHEKRADLIIVREGEGSMVVGGRLVDAKPTTPGEIRGKSIEGGETHSMAAGDTIWVPANTPHQFLVQPGKHFIAVIVKIEQN